MTLDWFHPARQALQDGAYLVEIVGQQKEDLDHRYAEQLRRSMTKIKDYPGFNVLNFSFDSRAEEPPQEEMRTYRCGIYFEVLTFEELMQKPSGTKYLHIDSPEELAGELVYGIV